MTPREEIENKERDLVRRRELAANWHHPLSKGSSILHKTLDTMREFKLVQEDVPLVVKLTENPNYFTSKLFTVFLLGVVPSQIEEPPNEPVSELNNNFVPFE